MKLPGLGTKCMHLRNYIMRNKNKTFLLSHYTSMKQISLSFLIIIFQCYLSFSQNSFQKLIGIRFPGEARSFCLPDDSSIMILCAGSLVKTDTNGNIIWVKNYLDPGIYGKNMIIKLNDNGFVMLYEILSGGFGESDIGVFNVSSEGLINWIKYYGTNLFNSPSYILELPDNDFMITGQSNSFREINKHEGTNIFLMRIGKYGEQYWQRSYGSMSNDDDAKKIAHSSFGGFILAGKISSQNALLRTDDNGLLKWAMTYNYGCIYDAIENPVNGNIYACGVSSPDNLRNASYVFVLNTDSLGNVIWAKKIGNHYNDIAYSITADESFSHIYITGEYFTDSLSQPKALISDIDAQNGDILWFNLYGSDEKNVFYDNVLFRGNSLINLGYSDFADTNYRNIYLVKTNLEGISGCNESILIPEVDSSLNMNATPASINIDTGDIWIMTFCSPPDYIQNYHELTLCMSSIDINENEISPLVYPNPCNEMLHIRYHDMHETKLEVYNTFGQLVMNESISGNSAAINVSEFTSGIYFIKITDGKKIFSQKIVINSL